MKIGLKAPSKNLTPHCSSARRTLNKPPQNFLIISRRGAIGLGEIKEIPWHKKEKENILKAVGIKVEYGEPIEVGEYRGKFMTVGDKEHAEIIRPYIEEQLSIDRIAKRLDRSTKTVWDHIQDHNRSVERSSFSSSCRRVRSKFEAEAARRG